MAAVAEGLALGSKLGLDPKLLSDIFNSSSARCWSSDSYNPCPVSVIGPAWSCVVLSLWTSAYKQSHLYSPLLLAPGTAESEFGLGECDCAALPGPVYCCVSVAQFLATRMCWLSVSLHLVQSEYPGAKSALSPLLRLGFGMGGLAAGCHGGRASSKGL